MKKIVFATGNAGKVREMRAMLGADVELLLQAELGIDSVEETGRSFTENALLKARHAAAASGLPALADDSGIEVDALEGAPGVRSARFAGLDASDADNLNKLLQDMQGKPDRAARFRCVLAFVRSADDQEPILAEGSWEGLIATEASGENGFGYDPIFIDATSGISSADLSAADKNARSHRGKALQNLRQLLHGVI